MKKIIGKRIFDTEKARLIVYSDNIGRGSDSSSDPVYWEAGLYKTPSGQFFLAGSGNAESPYANYTNPEGVGIIPITQDEAYDWAETYLSTEQMEQEFSDMITEA